jgi:hypothetical protein
MMHLFLLKSFHFHPLVFVPRKAPLIICVIAVVIRHVLTIILWKLMVDLIDTLTFGTIVHILSLLLVLLNVDVLFFLNHNIRLGRSFVFLKV